MRERSGDPHRSAPPLLEGIHLTKRFGDLLANDQVSIAIHRAETHVLLGENGAGKSTLMKTLYGVHQAEGGSIYVNGSPAFFTSPAQARVSEIGMVFQDFRLIPAFTVLENLSLAMADLDWFIQPARLRHRVNELAGQYGITVNPDVPVWQLDVGQRQRVEILKVLLTGARILILDEPTSVLAPTEVDPFLGLLRRLRDVGYGILMSTHKIREALASADRITVLRGGRVVLSTTAVRDLNEEALVRHMVGGQIGARAHKQTRASQGEDTPALSLRHVTVADDRGRIVVRDASLEIASAEIVGLAGISGNGQRELAEALVGLRPILSGQIILGGRELTGASPMQFLHAGVSCVPENPPEDSVVRGLSVLEHMMLVGLPERRRNFAIDWDRLYDDFSRLEEVKLLNLPPATRRADQLSGGNIQRLALAQALVRTPRILIACYPAHGLDVVTTHSIANILVTLRNQGIAVFLFSEDMAELYGISDSLVVLSHGVLFGPYDPKTTPVRDLAHVMLTGADKH